MKILSVLVACAALFAAAQCSPWCSYPYSYGSYYFYSYYYQYSTNGYLSSPDSMYTPPCSYTPTYGNWYTIMPSASGTLEISTCGTTWDTVVEASGGPNCDSRQCITTNDDGGFGGCDRLTSYISMWVEADAVYNVLIKPYGSGAGYGYEYQISFTFTPSSDHTSSDIGEAYCPSYINYLYDYQSYSSELTSWDTVEAGCWNYWSTYGQWFQYYPYSYQPEVHVCSDYAMRLTVADNLCSYGSPSCGVVYDSYWVGESDCNYAIDAYIAYNTYESVYFLLTSDYTWQYFTVDTYGDSEYSSDWFIDVWIGIIITLLTIGLIGVCCLLTACCCYKRYTRKKASKYQTVEPGVPIVEENEVPLVCVPATTPSQPATLGCVATPNADVPAPAFPPPPMYTPIYVPYPYGFGAQPNGMPIPVFVQPPHQPPPTNQPAPAEQPLYPTNT